DLARVLVGLDCGAHLVPSSSVPRSRPASADWAAAPPAGTKPAASAASAERNHTSATVWSYQREPSTWYFIESLLPLTEKPSGAEPSSVAPAESAPKPPSTSVAGAEASTTGSVSTTGAGSVSTTGAAAASTRRPSMNEVSATWVKTMSSAHSTSYVLSWSTNS